MMDIQTLVNKLQDSQIFLQYTDKKLSISGKKENLTTELLETIKLHKKALVEYLRSQDRINKSKTINLVEKREYYDLSHAQKRLWVIDQFKESKGAYNIPSTYYITGKIDKKAFDKAFSSIAERHESLRTTFILVDGEPCQKIHDLEKFEMNIRWLDIQNRKDKDEFVKNFCAAEAVAPFDLENGPLFRVNMIQLEPEKHLFIFNIHHITSDGWSSQVFTREILRLYQNFVLGSTDQLSPLRIQYKDYTYWQNAQLRGESLKHIQEYWNKQFSGELPTLDFPTDFSRPIVKTYNGSAQSINLDVPLSQSIQDFCNKKGATLFMTMVALLKALLFRYTGQSDIVLGSPIAGRSNQELESQIGFYVNMLALRTRFSASDSFEQLAELVKETTLNSYDHQIYPFDKLIEDLNIQRDLGRNPLFDMIINLQNATESKGQSSGVGSLSSSLQFEHLEGEVSSSKFDLIFNFLQTSAGIDFTILYNTDLFTQDRIERFLIHFRNMTEAALADPGKPLKDLGYITESENDQILRTFNNTLTAYPSDKTVQQLFEEQVRLYPSTAAIRFEDITLTYQEFDEITNKAGRYLRERLDIKPDDKIALITNRSHYTLIGIWSIIKAGACYVPIDPAFPESRIQFMLEDTGAKGALIHTNASFDSFPESCKKMELLEVLDESSDYSSKSLPIINSPTDLLYIIYTSGSTGKPKGATITHRNVIVRVRNASYYAMKPGNRSLLASNYTFDISILDIFGSLLNGGTVCIARMEDIVLVEPIAKLIKSYKVNNVCVATAIFNTLMDIAPECLVGIDKIYFGGEEASRKHIEIAMKFAPNAPVNVYGPTETTVLATIFEGKDLADHSKVPVGKPVSNSYIYILDDYQQVVPIGVSGEIYVGGDGVGRGYLNRDELTKERFVSDPFLKDRTVYKTGDMGRWLPDGSIVFEGRRDHQVKIRGYRIELGEIESALLSVPGIGEAVVLAKDSQDSKYLAAYYTIVSEQLEEEQIKSSLKASLPEYMLPSVFIKMEKFVLNSSGKVDKRLLPDPMLYTENLREEYVEPQTELQEKLHKIWREVLNMDRISITDNFFTIGGHSLKATKLILVIVKRLAVDLELRDIFANPTIETLAACITGKEQNVYKEIQLAPKQEYYNLSYAQRRLWILDQMEDKLTAYNIPSAYYLRGKLDRNVLEKAIQELVRRHEVLRTTFVKVDDEPKQKIHTSGFADSLKMEWADLSNNSNNEEIVEKLIEEEAGQNFDLQNGPLLKAKLVRLNNDYHLFLFTIHHILADGWSMGIITKEILALYDSISQGKGSPLESLRIQYKDYATWESGQLSGGALKRHKEYWLQKMASPLPVLDFPLDFDRPIVKTYEGRSISHVLTGSHLEKMRAVCKEKDCTMFMFLLAALNTLLFKYTGSTDFIIGSPAAGRNHPDLESQIGFYVNTLPLRTQFSPDDTVEDLLANVKKVLISAYDHQVYPFDMLVDDLNLDRDMRRTPLFDIMIAYQKQDDKQDANNSERDKTGFVSVEGLPVKTGTSKFDLTINVIEATNALIFSTDYCVNLFAESTIQRIHSHLEMLMEAMVAGKQKQLKGIDYLSDNERTSLFSKYEVSTRYVVDSSIVEMFDKAVKEFPDEIAIVCDDEKLTMSQLHRKANGFAAKLIEDFGVVKCALVPILLERTIEMPVAIWGILKAGAAFVPVDPQWPVDRIKEILQDIQASLLITNCKEFENAFDIPTYFLTLNAIEEVEMNQTLPVQLEDPIYAFYTSGSTGKPKGALNKHIGIANRFQFMTEEYAPVKGDSVLFTSNYVFDAAIWQLLWPSTLGLKMVIHKSESFFDLRAILDLVEEQQITITHFVPSVLNVLVDALAQQPELSTKLQTLRQLQVGGEAMSAKHVHIIKSLVPSLKVANDYGPTETSIGTLFYNVPQEMMSTVPIGRPMDYVPIRIMDAFGEPVPEGIIGELWLGGYCVGSGYLNRPELTAKAFVTYDQETFYRTGDQVKLMQDGNIEFLGRIDQQVKIRGYRIELEEIESFMMQHPEVKQASVSTWKDESGEKHLVGHYASENLSPELLRDYLMQKLPSYMVPEFIQTLDQLPLTTAGKVDRKALPNPKVNLVKSEVISPQTLTEQNIKVIWDEVLQMSEFGITDNFFALGGHSLRALQIQSRIINAFNIDIKIRDIFMLPTIKLLAKHIDQQLNQRSGLEDAESDELIELDLVSDEEQNTINLFCIPHGGGGKYVFEGMKKYAPETLQIEALELPGRGERSGEPFLQNVEDLVEDLYRQIRPKIGAPYALLGHSMGGLLSYLLTNKILENGGAPPEHIFISSCMAPVQYSEVITTVDEEEVKRSILKDYSVQDELLDYITPILSADINAMSTYRYEYSAPLNISITLFKGTQELINKDDMLGWKQITTEESNLIVFQGGHFHLFANEAEVMNCICDQLKQTVV